MLDAAAIEEPGIAFAALPYDVGLDPDDPASVFTLLSLGLEHGVPGALLTIIDISGGAPRGLGAQMAVLADGRYCGYVSGGCVEAAVAAEAMRAIEAGKDEILRFGTGSKFIDIRLPCGGSIDVHVHVRPDATIIAEALNLLAARKTFSLRFDTAASSVKLTPHSAPRARSEWQAFVFVRHYHPLTQLLLIGEGHELVALARLGCAAGLPVRAYMTAEAGSDQVQTFGAAVTLLDGADLPELPADPFTAIVFLLHDRFKEMRLLESALGYDPFYVGALGSRRTHAARVSRLEAAGVSDSRIAALNGPIGLFGPTRTASALAISVLGEITDARVRLDG
ncbi:XdhC family protein [Devosia aurantiaca]|uniref:XdhC family protein n=1 Tax=Devosia aurantiaca TaxID=2714858 RepID=A0A6M1SGX1_9HYPH|nr:XdhC family protein [Devosia aurantiaca]NGP16430.1 XdhC family protein [Devosia aurantiaca]